MKNSDKNQDVAVTSDYIIIKIDWENKLIFLLNDGLEFMRLWGSAQNMKDGKFERSDKSFEVSFINEQQLKELKMAAMIGSGDN